MAEVSSHRVKKHVKIHKSQRGTLFAKENRVRIEKSISQPAGQEENHEKGSR